MDLRTLEQRLRRLEDEKAILDTLYAYGHHLDEGLEDAWIDCWTEDAVLDWPGRAFMRGHAELRAGFRAHSHAPEMYHKHLVIAPRIALQGDTATAISMFARLDRYADGPGIRAFGRYRDQFIRCADGRWRIRERLPAIEAARTQAPLGGQPFPEVPLPGIVGNEPGRTS
ncbi:MAG: nuclear transport factor 2 family protein [Rhodoferax sp.]|nr:nuclear transport factor 2 family protein [Rhodoferax sp.]